MQLKTFWLVQRQPQTVQSGVVRILVSCFSVFLSKPSCILPLHCSSEMFFFFMQKSSKDLHELYITSIQAQSRFNLPFYSQKNPNILPRMLSNQIVFLTILQKLFSHSCLCFLAQASNLPSLKCPHHSLCSLKSHSGLMFQCKHTSSINALAEHNSPSLSFPWTPIVHPFSPAFCTCNSMLCFLLLFNLVFLVRF